MKPHYLQTYIITVAFVDIFQEAAKVLAARMRLAYEHSNIAGNFHWERLGRTTVLRFERSVPDDTETLLDLGRELTVETVRKQLAHELHEGQGALPAAQDGNFKQQSEIDEAFNLLTPIIEALNEGGDNVKVEGLTCQYPRLRIALEVVFVDGASCLIGKGKAAVQASNMAAYVGGNLVNVECEELSQ